MNSTEAGHIRECPEVSGGPSLGQQQIMLVLQVQAQLLGRSNMPGSTSHIRLKTNHHKLHSSVSIHKETINMKALSTNSLIKTSLWSTAFNNNPI